MGFCSPSPVTTQKSWRCQRRTTRSESRSWAILDQANNNTIDIYIYIFFLNLQPSKKPPNSNENPSQSQPSWKTHVLVLQVPAPKKGREMLEHIGCASREAKFLQKSVCTQNLPKTKVLLPSEGFSCSAKNEWENGRVEGFLWPPVFLLSKKM